VRIAVLVAGYVLLAIGVLGTAIELNGRAAKDARADVSGLVLAIAAILAGAFIAYSMHAGYRLRWQGALVVAALLFAASCWGDDIQRALRNEPFEWRPFLAMSVLPVVAAGVLTWYALG